MRVAVHQGPSASGAVQEGLAALDRSLACAAAAGADVLVMPELFLPGYNDPGQDQAARTGPGWDALIGPRAAGAGCALVVGLPERDGAALYNSAFAWGGDGARLASYRKVQLFGPRERQLFQPGDRLVTFALGDLKAALLICYDVEFAPHVKALVDQGVSLILVPTANMVPFEHVVRHTVPAMAANHGVAIAYANHCGTEHDLTYVGGSMIVGPHGEVLAQAGTGPALLIADLPAPDSTRLSTQSADFRVL